MMQGAITTSTPPTRAPRVFLLDDDPDTGESMRAVLVGAGYEVECHCDGRTALARLRECPADLLLLDLRMPMMDGWEFRVAQRADSAIADIPVVIMTADTSAKAAAIHADGSLLKPFGTEELLSTVARVLVEHDHHRLIEGLEQAGRLAVLGTVASSVGHEVNNPLLFAMASLALIERFLPDCRQDLALLEGPSRTAAEREVIDRLRQRIDAVDKHVADGRSGLQRVQVVVRNLQDLCLQADDERHPIAVHRVIEAAIETAWHTLLSRPQLTRDYAPIPDVWGNETRLTQVIIHILIHAARTDLATDSLQNEVRLATRSENGYVVIEIAGSAPSAASDALTRVFEAAPELGGTRGIGLGLPLCREIIEAHQGQLEVDIRPDSGNRFVVRLPCYASGVWPAVTSKALSRAPANPAAPLAVPAVPAVAQRAEPRVRLWIVDDEQPLARIIGRLLAREYDVLVSSGSNDVLTRLSAGERFDVLLCDVMMPEMTGVELAEHIEMRWPELKRGIVFMTGGALAPTLNAFVTAPGRLLLTKPFGSDEVRAMVTDVTAALTGAAAQPTI